MKLNFNPSEIDIIQAAATCVGINLKFHKGSIDKVWSSIFVDFNDFKFLVNNGVRASLEILWLLKSYSNLSIWWSLHI